MSSMPELNKEVARFIESYIRYYPRIFRYVLTRIDGDIHSAEDITQEVFTRFLTRGGTLGSHAVHNWLYSASKNILFEHYRDNRRFYNCEDIDSPLYVEDEALSYLEEFDLRLIIDDVLRSIGDPMDIMIFEYVALCGLTYRETARLLTLPHRRVKYRFPVILKNVISTLSQKGIKQAGDII